MDKPRVSLAKVGELITKESGSPFAMIHHYLRTHLGIEDVDLMDYSSAFFEMMQAEFRLVPNEVGQLYPRQVGALLDLLHRLRTGPTEDARNQVLLEAKELRDGLAAMPSHDSDLAILLKALGRFPPPSGAVPSTSPLPTPRLNSPNFERNEFVVQRYLAGDTHAEIAKKVKEHAGWRRLSMASIRQTIARHWRATRQGDPPSRK
jgi:hypothetical protein